MALLLLILAGVLFGALWSMGEASREEAADRQVSEICARLRSGGEAAIDSMTKTPPLDPWNGRYSIEADGKEVTVRSAGPDGVFDSEDDVAAVLDTATGRRAFIE